MEIFMCRDQNPLRAFMLFTFVTLLFVLLIRCSFSTMQFLDPEYEADKIFETSVLVMPLTTEYLPFEVQDSLSTNKPFKRKTVSNYEINYFNRILPLSLEEFTTASILGIDPYFIPLEIEFVYEPLVFENKSRFHMFLPKTGQIQYHEKKPEFILFIEDLYFDKTFEESSGGLGRGTQQKYVLEAGFEYFIYHNIRQKAVAYGKIDKHFNLMEMPSKDDYSAAIEELTLAIVDKSPFVKRQIQGY